MKSVGFEVYTLRTQNEIPNGTLHRVESFCMQPHGLACQFRAGWAMDSSTTTLVLAKHKFKIVS